MNKILLTLPIVAASLSAQMVGLLGSPRHLNDQDSGVNGAPNTGAYNLGDTWMFTWSGDGNYYATLNDGGVRLYSRRAAESHGRNARFGFGNPLERKHARGIRHAGQNNTSGWSDGSTWKSNCLASIHHVLYMCDLPNLTCPSNGQNESLQESYDHGLTWCNYTYSTPTGCSISAVTAIGLPVANRCANSPTITRGLHPLQYCQDNSI